jgi:hypothetical protein
MLREAVNRLKNGVLAGTYRPISGKTQLIDALIESYEMNGTYP